MSRGELELRNKGQMASKSKSDKTVTFKELLKSATEHQVGKEDIRIRDVLLTERQLTEFLDSIFVKVIRREEKPMPVSRTTVDISTKEFKNDAVSKDPSITDTTKVIVKKSSFDTKGRNYQWTSSDSTTWNIGGSLGMNVGVLTYGGVNAGVNAGFSKTKGTSQTQGDSHENSLGFEYSQEETICVPPGKIVHVIITTYLVNYELPYTLEFSVAKSGSIYVSYIDSCCCGLVTNTKTAYVPYEKVISKLPGYREDTEKAYFTQDLKLTWVGESCLVEKSETSLADP